MAKKLTHEEVLRRIKEYHGDTYDYSKFVYVGDVKSIFICREHGEFLMRPRSLFHDHRGCPKCDDGSKSGFSKSSKWFKDPKHVYLIECIDHGEHFLKVGVTKEYDAEKRMLKGQVPYDYKSLVHRYFMDGVAAMDLEDLIKKKYSHLSYMPKTDFTGKGECFTTSHKKDMIADIRNFVQSS